MGRDKAWLPVGDEPALGRVVRVGLEAGLEVVVVGSRGQALPTLAPGVTRVDDPVERAFEGPLSGLAVGLALLRARGVELVAAASCDALLMGPEHLRFVLDALARSDRAALVPVDPPGPDGAGRMHPLCAAMRVAEADARARALLEAGRRAARDLLQSLHAEEIAVSVLPEPAVVEAVNTPAQWDAAVARLRAQGRLRSTDDHVE
ncbi:MAG: NTP transferase domain-containing protein [Myxococcales bacterium]|nr:NTP transferase domain-containing protein [Myxococcales bacterium]